ncbi:MAG TPA: YugN-like family protein [Bacillales bacterium]|nr:YugN-like family protein [Bacillales bacterium]
MIKLESSLTGTEHSLYELERILKPLGYTIGGNWDYDHGSFDYKVNETDGYLFLRIPFEATAGSLDYEGVEVVVGTPYLLNHKYEAGLDQENGSGTMGGLTNQFQEPVDKDDGIPERSVEEGRDLLKEAEKAVLS